jgi:hypothetical protein
MKLEKKLRRHLRKKQLAARYGYDSDRSIDRAVKDGRLPPPDMYVGRFPLWSEETLDAHDAKAARALLETKRRKPAAEKARGA